MDNWKPDEKVIEYLEKTVNESENPDEPFIGGGNKSYSIREILEEIKTGTPFGRELHQNYLDLEKECGSSE